MSELVNKPPRLDITVVQGSTLGPIMGTMRDGNGQPMDISGFTFVSQIRRRPSSVKPTCVAVTAIADAPNGQYTFAFEAADTALLHAGDDEQHPDSQYEWDMRAVDASGRVIPLWYGTVRVFREISRS